MKLFPLNPYRYAVAWRNHRYDTGAAVSEQADVPVISVGNISAGGTGKTPFVRWMTKLYREHGIMPAVVSRGYGRTTKGALLVSDGHNEAVSPDESGDELALHAMDGNIVVAAEQRIEGCRIAIRHGAQICIIDDGFQHRQLRRDLDIVLIDRATLYGSLLPFGRLREPLTALKRAHVVAIHEQLSEEETRILPTNPNSLVIRYDTEVVIPYFATSPKSRLPGESVPSYFKGNPTLAVCGIAKPERFIVSAEKAGFSVTQTMTFPDHVRYDAQRIQTILDACAQSEISQILTTEKDIVKLMRHYYEFTTQAVKIIVLPVHIVVTSGKEALLSILRSLIP